MKPLTLKQSQRLEKKKKKMAAFLEIAKLNDKDREAKETKQRAREESTSDSSDSDNSVTEKSPHDGPSRKRAKKYHDLDEPLELTNSIDGSEPIEADPCVFSTPGTPESASGGPKRNEHQTEEDYIELRRRLRERRQLFKNMPLIRLKPNGQMASLALGEDYRTPLFLSDIQHLLLYSILGNNAPYNPLAWCHIEKARSISQTVFLLFEDISLYDFQAYQSCFPNLTTYFPIQVEVITPSAYNGDFIEELSLVPLTHIKEKKLLNKFGNLEAALRADSDIHQVLRAIFPVLETDKTGQVTHEKDNVDMVQYPSLQHQDQFQSTQLMDQSYPLPVKGQLKHKVIHEEDNVEMCVQYPSLQHQDQFPHTKLIDQSYPLPVKDQLKHKVIHEEDNVEMIEEYPSLAHLDQFPRTKLIMSVGQLLDEGYPLPIKGPLRNRYQNYVCTKDLYSAVTPQSPMFALDCEMCMTTTKDLELTRISIVDEQLNCIYDSLVLPYNNIINYLTKYSGITKAMLANVTKRLEDVQEDLREMLPMDAILIGQSLNGDLHALKMMHPYIIDTSVIFNITGNYKRKTKLKVMSMKFLGEDIQSNPEGHCPTEDAEACMKLVQLKLANNIAFGDTILARHRLECRSMTQSMVTMASPEIMAAWQEKTIIQPKNRRIQPQETVAQPQQTLVEAKEEHLASTMFNFFRHHEKSVAIVSVRSIIDEYSTWINARLTGNSKKNKKVVECITATSMENVIPKMGAAASKHALTLGHLLYDGKELDKCSNKENVFREIDSWCKQIWESLQSNALCLIMFGGRQGGANGVCFMRIKRCEPSPCSHD